MAPIGSGNPELLERNRKERERYMMVSDTIDKLRAKLKLDTRYQTPILQQSLAGLVRLKAENRSKTFELQQLYAELRKLGVAIPTEPREPTKNVPSSRKTLPTVSKAQGPSSYQTPAFHSAWVLPDGSVVPAAMGIPPQHVAMGPLVNPMLIPAGYSYGNPLQQQFLMQAMMSNSHQKAMAPAHNHR